MIWNLVSVDEVRLLDLSDQFLAFSQAYLDSAIHLCSMLVKDNSKTTYERGAVVMFLALQATELFLKGAILKKDRTSSLSSRHEIEPLFNRYKKLYPAMKYSINVLFHTEEPDLTGVDPEIIKQYKAEKDKYEKKYPEHQRYRYPVNNELEPFGGSAGFEANLFLIDLKKFKEEVIAITAEFELNI